MNSVLYTDGGKMEKSSTYKVINLLTGIYKQKGELTYDDINKSLKDIKITVDQIENILAGLKSNGITIGKKAESERTAIVQKGETKDNSPVELSEKIQKEITRLIALGKKKGKLSYDEVGEKIAVECEANAREMDEVFRILDENGINIINNTIITNSINITIFIIHIIKKRVKFLNSYFNLKAFLNLANMLSPCFS